MTDDRHSPINMGVYRSVWMPGIKFFSKKYSANASGRRKSEISHVNATMLCVNGCKVMAVGQGLCEKGWTINDLSSFWSMIYIGAWNGIKPEITP